MNPISFSSNIIHSPNGIGIIGTGKCPITELTEKIKELEKKGIKVIIVDSDNQDTIDINKLKESIVDRLKDIETVKIKDSRTCIADNAPLKRIDYLKSPHPNRYLVQNNLKPKSNPNAQFYRARSTPKKVK